MYPLLRLSWQFFKHRKSPPLGGNGTHVSQHICMPSDIDIWMEMNNGRILTIYDIGRLVFGQRLGMMKALKENRWGSTMAGVSVRYRRRIRMFQRFEMRSRAIGYDDKFIYLEQSMWRKGECCSHAMYRSAVTDKNGLIPSQTVLDTMGLKLDNKIPDWVNAWIDAEAKRPWPPMQDDIT